MGQRDIRALLESGAMAVLQAVERFDTPNYGWLNRPACAVSAMHLEHILHQIESDCDNLRHDRSPFCGSLQIHLGTSMPSGGGYIIKAVWLCNQQLPQSVLGSKTPLQTMKDRHTQAIAVQATAILPSGM
jgi:hypothetical protein